MQLFLSLLQAFSIVLLSTVAAEDPVVKTSLGHIRGKEVLFNGESVDAYLGVPYAKPPQNELRFATPKKIEPWGGIREAKELAKSCMQTPDETYPGFNGSEMWNSPTELTEDCLNMNIWVPKTETGLKQVIVWIFGGGFFSGSPSLSVYNGTALAYSTGAIVVNINYRVGPFGFLYFGDESSAPGNMGLLDQQLALEWIHDHIESFGGNPLKVTLFGESAGAASVTAHLAAPDSHKYFNKVILNSGSIRHVWATESKDRMRSMSTHLAEGVNCTTDSVSTESILDCMRKVDAKDIQAEANKLWPSEILSFPFVPIRDDKNFFKGLYQDHFTKGTFKNNVAVMLGEVTDEGTFWLPYNLYNFGFVFNNTIDAEDERNSALIDEEQYKKSFQALMTYFHNSTEAEKILSDGYREASSRSVPAEKLRDGVAQYVGDFFFSCDVREFADLIADKVSGGVYKYTFTMRSSANPWPKWMGVMHGYEIEYEFGQPLLNSSIYDQEQLETEIKFSKYIMDLIKSFITTGKPHNEWPLYKFPDRQSFVLGKETVERTEIREDVRGHYCELINKAKEAAVAQIKENDA